MKWKKLFPGPIAKNLWHQVQQLYVILSCEKKRGLSESLKQESCHQSRCFRKIIIIYSCRPFVNVERETIGIKRPKDIQTNFNIWALFGT